MWTPVPCGLASDSEFEKNMQRFSDANDSWTQIITFGSVGLDNHGREARKNARKVGYHKSILIFSFKTSHLFISSCPHNIIRRHAGDEARPCTSGPAASSRMSFAEEIQQDKGLGTTPTRLWMK